MEKNSSSRRIEMTVLSGEDLRIDRRSVKKNTFVIVQTDAFDSCKTKIDELGGSYPSWNEKLFIDLPMHVRFITLQVQCKTSSRSNKIVGFAKVPISDFVGGHIPENYLHFLSYRLRDVEGEKNGIINISIRVKTTEYASCSTQTAGLNLQGYTTYSTPAGFGVPVGGIVTGVPLW